MSGLWTSACVEPEERADIKEVQYAVPTEVCNRIHGGVRAEERTHIEEVKLAIASQVSWAWCADWEFDYAVDWCKAFIPVVLGIEPAA